MTSQCFIMLCSCGRGYIDKVYRWKVKWPECLKNTQIEWNLSAVWSTKISIAKYYTEEQNLAVTNQTERVTSFHNSEAGRQSVSPLDHCRQNVRSFRTANLLLFLLPSRSSSACVCTRGSPTASCCLAVTPRRSQNARSLYSETPSLLWSQHQGELPAAHTLPDLPLHCDGLPRLPLQTRGCVISVTCSTGLGGGGHSVVIRAGGSSAPLHALSVPSQDVFAVVSLSSAIYEHAVLSL